VNRNGKTTQIAVQERNARREKKTKNGIDGGKKRKDRKCNIVEHNSSGLYYARKVEYNTGMTTAVI